MKPQVLVIGFVALLAAVWGFLPPFTVTLLCYIGLYSLVAVGLVMLTGVGGMTSFGQAAFVGLGAYATAWICTAPEAAEWLSFLPKGLYPWVGLVLGLLVTALIAWGLGAVTLRLSGHYLPLGTIAWGLSLYYIFGNLQVLLPMVSHVREVDEAIGVIDRTVAELRDEGRAVTRPPVGVMVEVPAAALQTAALARRADFLSIGTNDLIQYLLAVDRNNARVAALYDGLHPAVLQTVNWVVQEGHRTGTRVGVCGEMAGDPASALLLLGMGVDSMSMAASSLPRVKWVVRSFTRDHARDLLQEALGLEEAFAVRLLLHAALKDAGLGNLIRPLKSAA